MSVSYCFTCKVPVGGENCRDHFRSQWHIFNLKRTGAFLPPLSEKDYQDKSKAFGTLANRDRGTKDLYCSVCKRTYINSNTYENHIKSWKHKANLETRDANESVVDPLTDEAGKKVDEESKNEKLNPVSDEETPVEKESLRIPLPVGACFFCDEVFTNDPRPASRVLRHMKVAHDFEVPYPDKLVDAHGLLSELGRLVGVEFACLGCGRQFVGRKYGREKQSPSQLRKEALAALRFHMSAKRHNFVHLGVEDPVVVALSVAEIREKEGEKEEQHSLRKGASSSLPPIARIGGEYYSQFYAPIRANNTLVLPNDEDYAPEEEYEVRLPTGGVMGHRRYRNVYRQNLETYVRDVAERCRNRALTDGSDESSLVQVGGGNNRGSLVAVSEFPRRVPREVASEQIRRQRLSDKYLLNLGVRGNFFLRGHLRRQY